MAFRRSITAIQNFISSLHYITPKDLFSYSLQLKQCNLILQAYVKTNRAEEICSLIYCFCSQ